MYRRTLDASGKIKKIYTITSFRIKTEKKIHLRSVYTRVLENAENTHARLCARGIVVFSSFLRFPSNVSGFFPLPDPSEFTGNIPGTRGRVKNRISTSDSNIFSPLPPFIFPRPSRLSCRLPAPPATHDNSSGATDTTYLKRRPTIAVPNNRADTPGYAHIYVPDPTRTIVTSNDTVHGTDLNLKWSRRPYRLRYKKRPGLGRRKRVKRYT